MFGGCREEVLVTMNSVQVSECKICKLCHRNGESEVVYRSHNMKDREGKLVTCPVLRKYTCTLCGQNGDNAHTIRYCPLNKDGTYNSGASLAELKKRRNAAGNYPGHGDRQQWRPNTVMVCPPLPRHIRQLQEQLETDHIIARIRHLEKEAASLRYRYMMASSSHAGPGQDVRNVYSGFGGSGSGLSPWFPHRTQGWSPSIGRTTEDEARLGFLRRGRGNPGLVDSWIGQGQGEAFGIGQGTGDSLGAMLAELRMGSEV